MYSKIIVPLDGSELSEQALPYAGLVAASLSAPIELVQAFDILPPGLLGPRHNAVVGQLERAARQHARDGLQPARQRLEAEGHTVSIVTHRGPASDVIVARAGTDPTALVVMCTHGRGGITRWVMGSVTDKALHTMPNPMLIVRAAHDGAATDSIAGVGPAALETVVAPLDGSPLSELALPHAVSVAAALSADIAILRITPTESHYRRELAIASPEMGAMVDFDPATPSEMVAEDTAAVEQYLEGVRARLETEHAGSVTAEHIRSDNIAQSIIERAAVRPSLVVMTTHGRSGVGRMVMGSVTDRVIRYSNTPALVIR